MKAVGGHTGAIASVVKGEVPYKEDVKGHAHATGLITLSCLLTYPWLAAAVR